MPINFHPNKDIAAKRLISFIFSFPTNAFFTTFAEEPNNIGVR